MRLQLPADDNAAFAARGSKGRAGGISEALAEAKAKA
jgi:hypothetical protein